jgi:hypothetical protein
MVMMALLGHHLFWVLKALPIMNQYGRPKLQSVSQEHAVLLLIIRHQINAIPFVLLRDEAKSAFQHQYMTGQQNATPGNAPKSAKCLQHS